MGQTKRIRKKYETPTHPWQRERILEEKEYTRDYGFKNKKEIWKETAKLRKARLQAKKLIADKLSEQARKEEKQLIERLIRFGLLKKDSKLEDVLGLTPKDFFERRLQTIVFKKGFARSPKQSRQFIVHGHVMIDNKKITAPSYMVSLEEESKIVFNPVSSLSKADHPERAVFDKKDKKVLEEIKEKKTKEVPKEEVKEEKPAEAPKAEEAVKEEPKKAEAASE